MHHSYFFFANIWRNHWYRSSLGSWWEKHLSRAPWQISVNILVARRPSTILRPRRIWCIYFFRMFTAWTRTKSGASSWLFVMDTFVFIVLFGTNRFGRCFDCMFSIDVCSFFTKTSNSSWFCFSVEIVNAWANTWLPKEERGERRRGTTCESWKGRSIFARCIGIRTQCIVWWAFSGIVDVVLLCSPPFSETMLVSGEVLSSVDDSCFAFKSLLSLLCRNYVTTIDSHQRTPWFSNIIFLVFLQAIFFVMNRGMHIRGQCMKDTKTNRPSYERREFNRDRQIDTEESVYSESWTWM